MQKNLADAPNSQFVDWNKNLEAYTEGWHLVYANQCPWHIKSVQDLKAEASKQGLILNVWEMNSAE
jgi:hypothetical protein